MIMMTIFVVTLKLILAHLLYKLQYHINIPVLSYHAKPLVQNRNLKKKETVMWHKLSFDSCKIVIRYMNACVTFWNNNVQSWIFHACTEQDHYDM